MQKINLTTETSKSIDLRESLLMCLGSIHPVRESRVLKDIAALRERLVDSKSSAFNISTIELRYCVNAVLLSDLGKDEKFAILNVLDKQRFGNV